MSVQPTSLTWPPSAEEIQAITALEDVALRNLKITQTYHRLTVALSEFLGAENVSWCAYATWASRTAGVFIRGDNVEVAIRRYLDSSEQVIEELGQMRSMLRRLGQRTSLDQLVLVQVLDTVTSGMEQDIGYGNLIVFAELAPVYRRLLDLLAESETYDEAKLERLLADFTPGRVEDGGQDLLHQAFTLCYRARFESDHKTKAELLFFSNVLVGLHEQTRLQGPISAAMQAPLTEEVEQVLSDRLDAWMRLHLLRPIGALARLVWRRRLRGLAIQLADDWRRITTELMMTMELPSETLYLGRDVPPAPDGYVFPPALEAIDNPDLQAILAPLDRTPDDAAGSGARDWADLDDRMNFIADFFRSRQQDGTLFEPPFSEDQVAAIDAGNVPDGAL